MAEDTITIPGMGPTKKTYVYIGAAVVAGLVAFAYWRRTQQPAPPSWADVAPAEMTPDSDYDSPGGGNSSVSADLTGDTITTNAQWSQKATTLLGNLGYDPKLVASALGRYFNREGLTADQMDAVKAAVGQLGPPPVGGPWPIQAAPPASGGPLGKPGNLRVTGVTRNTVGLAWDAVPGAQGYQIEWEGKTGKYHTRFDKTSGTSYTVTDMPLPNEDYVLNVRAFSGSQQGDTATITARTTA